MKHNLGHSALGHEPISQIDRHSKAQSQSPHRSPQRGNKRPHPISRQAAGSTRFTATKVRSEWEALVTKGNILLDGGINALAVDNV